VLFVVIVFVSPGILVIGLVNSKLLLHLDTGQLWTFSILTAAFFYGLMAFLRKSVKSGLKIYVLLCVIIVIIGLVSHFGFKLEWPELLLEGFI
jgi:hypothetical protein